MAGVPGPNSRYPQSAPPPLIWPLAGEDLAVFNKYLGIWVLGWGGAGSPEGLVHNLLMQFFTLDSSKIEVFETYFFHIVITQNDHPSYVKHVLGCIYVFFTLFGYWGGGGLSHGMGTQPACAVFHPTQLKNRSFRNSFF